MRVLSHFSPVRLFATPWTVACQAPLSMGFSRRDYWSGLPCSPPGDLPDPGTEALSHLSAVLLGRFFTHSTTWEALQGAMDLLSLQEYLLIPSFSSCQWFLPYPSNNLKGNALFLPCCIFPWWLVNWNVFSLVCHFDCIPLPILYFLIFVLICRSSVCY